MGLPTGSSGSSTPPSLKLPNEGNTLTFAVIDSNPDVPVIEFGTGNPVLNRYGKPKMQTALTVLVVAAEGATIGAKDVERPAAAGDVGTIYVDSYMKWDPDEDAKGGTYLSFGGAVDALPGGADAFDIGCVGQWKHLGELPSKGTFPRKNRKFALRLPKPEESAQTAKCQQLHDEMADNGPFDGQPEPQPAVTSPGF